jgi:hypothetical protein
VGDLAQLLSMGKNAVKNNNGQHCPAEKLNKKRYHKNWLQNLLIATSNARKK